MPKVPRDIAEVAAALYLLIDENGKNDRLLGHLSIITYFFFQNYDRDGGEGIFFQLDEWISLLAERNEGKNPYVVDMANNYGDTIEDYPEVKQAIRTLEQDRLVK